MSPRAATLHTPPRPTRSPAAGSPATYRHNSSTLSSCRLLDCTPWAPAAASRLRLLLRLLSPAAARRPDKRAEGDGGRGGPRSKDSPERDGERVPGGPEIAQRGWQRRRRATLGRGRPPGGGAASWEQPLRPRGGGNTATGRRRNRGRSGCHRSRLQQRSVCLITHTVRRCAQADLGPVLRVWNALPPCSPLGLARTGCTGAEPAHSAPAQTDPGQSRPLRQGSRLSPPPPPRRACPSPPRAAGTPRGTRWRAPQGCPRAAWWSDIPTRSNSPVLSS